MPKRKDREKKCNRWAFFLCGQRYSISNKILREVVHESQVGLTLVEVGPARVEIVWPRPVTFQSALRLVYLARKDERFCILADPVAIGEEAGAAASAGQETSAAAASAKATTQASKCQGCLTCVQM